MENRTLKRILYFILNVVLFLVIWIACDWLWCRFVSHSLFYVDWQRGLLIGVILGLLNTYSMERKGKKKETEDKR